MANAKEKAIELDRRILDKQTVESVHQIGYTKVRVKSTFGSHDSVSDLLYHTVLKKLQTA